MQNVSWVGVALLVICSFASKSQANPASTDYVNRKINDLQTTFSLALQQVTASLGSEINGLRKQPHRMGEIYQGGRIFFVDSTGEHGLITALTDANEGVGISWQNGESGEKITNAQASGINAGINNTRLAIAAQTMDWQNGNFAALAAMRFSVLADGRTPCTTKADNPYPCYGDWYLPSIYELDLMRLNLQPITANATALYWSSTEISVTEAWAEDINTGEQWRNGNSGNKIINARGDGVGAGEANTQIIISQQTMDNQAGNFAALAASRYRIGIDGETPCTTPDVICHGGWYLPSLFELSLMRNVLAQQGLGDFSSNTYWSSTEITSTSAWMVDFATGEFIKGSKANNTGLVRAVSRF